MATFSYNEAENYGNAANSGSFFQLKDDGDSAKVHFLYNTIEDVKGYAVHQVELVGSDGSSKKRYVNCLRNYTDPLDMCPLCKAQYKVMPKMFLKLYNVDADECQIWERGKSYFQKMASLASHYNPICNAEISIERHGKKGDKNTTYDFWPGALTDFNIDEHECPEPLGTIILDKTADEMNSFLTTGSFPGDGNTQTQTNVQEGVERRTPSNTPPRRAF